MNLLQYASVMTCFLLLSCSVKIQEQVVGEADRTIRKGIVNHTETSVGKLTSGTGATCTGTLICTGNSTSQVILTANHCNHSTLNFSNATTPGTVGQPVSSQRATMGIANSTNDGVVTLDGIALLRINNWQSSAAIRQVARTPAMQTGQLAPAFGYGRSATTPSLSGTRQFGNMTFSSWGHGDFAIPGSIMSFTPANDRITCPGDSGGPILNANDEIVGVTYYAKYADEAAATAKDCSKVIGADAFNVSTTRVRDFIQSHMNAWCEAKAEVTAEARIIQPTIPVSSNGSISFAGLMVGGGLPALNCLSGPNPPPNAISSSVCRQKFPINKTVTLTVSGTGALATKLSQGFWACRQLGSLAATTITHPVGQLSVTETFDSTKPDKANFHCLWTMPSPDLPAGPTRKVFVSHTPVPQAGLITDDTAQINCGGTGNATDCHTSFHSTTPVRLRVITNPVTPPSQVGYLPFYSWEALPGKPCDCLNPFTKNCDIPAGTTDQYCVAKYEYASRKPRLRAMKSGKYTSLLYSTPNGLSLPAGESIGEAPFDFGSTVEMKVSPNPTSLIRWEEDCTGTGVCKVQMLEDRKVTAVLRDVHTFVLTVVNPPGGGHIYVNDGDFCFHNDCQNKVFERLAGAGPSLVRAFPINDVTVTTSSWELDEWSGDCTGKNPECTVDGPGEKRITAKFRRKMRKIQVTKTGKGTGNITFAPEGEACGENCRSYPFNTDVTVTANGTNGGRYLAFTPPQRFSPHLDYYTFNDLREDQNLSVEFGLAYDLRISRLPADENGGKVTSGDEEIDCGTDCHSTYASGNVVLTATPAEGWFFEGWKNADCTGLDPCTVTMDRHITMEAKFYRKFNVRVLPAQDLLGLRGTGIVTSEPPGINCGGPNPTPEGCNFEFKSGTTINLIATATDGSFFHDWIYESGAHVNSRAVPVTMNGPKEMKVDFRKPYTLSVNFIGNGGGLVHGNGVSCRASCAVSLPRGVGRTLNHTADANSTFMGWGGACGAGNCVVNGTNGNVTITADFSTTIADKQACIAGPPELVFAPPTAGGGTTASLSTKKDWLWSLLDFDLIPSASAASTLARFAIERAKELNAQPSMFRKIAEVPVSVRSYRVWESPFRRYYRVAHFASGTTSKVSPTVEVPPDPAAFTVVTGPGPAAGTAAFHVNTYRADTTLNYNSLTNLTPYGSFGGGFAVASADVDADGTPDLITGAGPGGGPHVKVFSGRTGAMIREFFAYAAGFKGGIHVASADFNNDGFADIVTAPRQGGGPHVIVFDGRYGTVIHSFMAYGAGFTGGVSVAAGDLNGDGTPDIVTGAGPGGGPHILGFDGKNLNPILNFMAFATNYTGGTYVAAGDMNGDGRAEVVVGSGEGVPPHVRVHDGQSGANLTYFFPLNQLVHSGTRVAMGDLDGDGNADVLVANGGGVAPDVRGYKFSSLTAAPSQLPGAFVHYSSLVQGGLFVAVAAYR